MGTLLPNPPRQTDRRFPGLKNTSITYKGLHTWINRNFGTPRKCDLCSTTKKTIYDWANISERYLRDRNDWTRLCRKCHRSYDKMFGEGNGRAKLSEGEVLKIRREYKPRVCTQGMLAVLFRVSKYTIKSIVNRKSWRHV